MHNCSVAPVSCESSNKICNYYNFINNLCQIGILPYNVPIFCFMVFTTIKGIKIVPFFKQIGQFPHEITLLKNWEFAWEFFMQIPSF